MNLLYKGLAEEESLFEGKSAIASDELLHGYFLSVSVPMSVGTRIYTNSTEEAGD